MKKKSIPLLLVLIGIFLLACSNNTASSVETKPSENNSGFSEKESTLSGNLSNKESVFSITDMSGMDFITNNPYYSFQDIQVIDDVFWIAAGTYDASGYTQHYIQSDFNGNIQKDILIYEETPEISVENADQNIRIIKEFFSHTILPDGKLAYVEYEDRYHLPTDEVFQHYSLVLLDTSGTELFHIELSEHLSVLDFITPDKLILSEADTIYFRDSEKIIEIAMDGTIIGEYKPDDVTMDLYEVSFYKDGYPVFAVWNEDYTKLIYQAVDIRTGSIREELTLPDALSGLHQTDGTDSGYDLILTDNTAVYGYNFGDETASEIMNFLNSNLGTYHMSQVCFMDKDHFIGVYNDFIQNQNYMAGFTKVPPDEVPDKQIIRMAVYGSDSFTASKVIEFNQKSDTYQVIIEDYSKYIGLGGWRSGMEQLNLDIISGKIPDIIKYSQNLDDIAVNYASKGIFVDFYELIDKDTKINRSDYAENVLKAYEMNGKLYQLPTLFYISGFMGKTSIWGTENSISWEDVNTVLTKYPEASLFSNELTKSIALHYALPYVYAQVVNDETGECHFHSEAFKEMLEFANSFPTELDYTNMDNDYWRNYETQYRENRTLLHALTIHNIYDVWRYSVINFGEPVTWVGFPTNTGQGSTITASMSYSISAKSDCIDGAWEFVRQFILEENQTIPEGGDRYSLQGIPILKKGIVQQAEYITKRPTTIGKEGYLIEYNDLYMLGGYQFTVEPASKDEMQHWLDFIYSVERKAPVGYEKAVEIISEEAEAYFHGKKSVEDVMDIIQSRMSIFISESR